MSPFSISSRNLSIFFFFFNDTATTEIYTLSLHDALPIYGGAARRGGCRHPRAGYAGRPRSEEHTSELQSPYDLVCRLLLEKKKILYKAVGARIMEAQGTALQRTASQI